MVASDQLKSVNALRAARGFMQIGSNAVGAAVRVVNSAIHGHGVLVSQEEQDRRFSICRGCDMFDGSKCKLCGCYAHLKARLQTEHCPILKW